MYFYNICFFISREEYGIQRDPYEDEIKLCNTLINYLQKFKVTEDEVEEPSKNPGKVLQWFVVRISQTYHIL
jgi:hypothetical protein